MALTYRCTGTLLLVPALLLAVFGFAGGRDDAVSKALFYAGMNKLESYGTSVVQFTVHEDMGHDTWTRVYASQDLYQWLLQYHR